MVKIRKRIGILFISDDIGVIYYLVNIVRTLEYLPDYQKPDIVVFYNSECEKHLNLFNYPFIKKVWINFRSKNRIKFYLKSLISQKNLFYEIIISECEIDAIFPFNDFPIAVKTNVKIISWIPDFQHKFFPKYFNFLNLILREIRFKSIIKNTNTLVLSSFDSYGHLKKFYKIKNNLNIKILQFVSTIKNNKINNINFVKKNYNIENPFFLVSNQFYEHKNHYVVLKAIKELKEQQYKFQVIFSGKTEDYRNPSYFPSILDFINKNNLQSYIKILGLIPRENQLSLLKNSLAVIQPSKFEGWSTIIEDSKTLSHQIICSKLPVHIEQLGNNGFYFEPDSVDELASIMKSFLDGSVKEKNIKYSYEKRVKSFAQTFVEILD